MLSLDEFHTCLSIVYCYKADSASEAMDDANVNMNQSDKVYEDSGIYAHSTREFTSTLGPWFI